MLMREVSLPIMEKAGAIYYIVSNRQRHLLILLDLTECGMGIIRTDRMCGVIIYKPEAVGLVRRYQGGLLLVHMCCLLDTMMRIIRRRLQHAVRCGVRF